MKYFLSAFFVFNVGLAAVNCVAANERYGRYTVVQTGAEPSEMEPLSAVAWFQFPSHVVTVHKALRHLLRMTGYTLTLAPEVSELFDGLELPSSHREIGPIKILDALSTVAGPAWRLTIDRRLRTVSFVDAETATEVPGNVSVAAAANNHTVSPAVSGNQTIGSVDEPIITHHNNVTLKRLVDELVPAGWKVEYQVPAEQTAQKLRFHAETTRRRALEELLDKLQLRGIFYSGSGLLLITGR